ncbi:L-sorbose 1-dehydrogenase [Trametes pubescens]|uniref:L-sorbose 1-dehydrogenase n=1 Tax=Trametes pubescens TaxID=154538 RepID=A0A1M2VXJ0_TRAPU|nr:L-sorbose 1-dehydrogenase [Trametes pubescens]
MEDISVQVIPAIESVNISWVGDLNNPSIPAAVIGNLDVIEDKCFHRASTYRAFLPGNLAQDRKARLKICTNTIVMRLNLVNEDGAVWARGVHIESLNPRMAEFTYYAKARREIVLSAGALGSPQILMLSGIGPRAHLEEKNVPVVLDLSAVGNHLQDHIGVPLTYQVPMSDSLHQLKNNIFSAITAALTYIFTGRGLFSSPFQSITSLLPTRLLDERSGRIVVPDPSVLDASIPANRPDLEFMPLANNSTDADIPGKGIFTLLPTLILPKLQGRVRLAANNPRVRADIELGFFTNPADYVPLRKGVHLALRVATELHNSRYPLQELIIPGDDSDSEVDVFIRKNLRDCYHYTSTCRMGVEARGPRQSVVDTAMCVHGVRGLRVCDTSVFPEVVAMHTMALAVVVAEKCTELIRLDAKM